MASSVSIYGNSARLGATLLASNASGQSDSLASFSQASFYLNNNNELYRFTDTAHIPLRAFRHVSTS